MKLLQNLRKDKKGFTLIEVVIVLAIAALILVIVFLAVQGAQKSQRDNANKQMAGRAIAAAQNFLSDNNNTFTNGVDATGGCVLDGGNGCKLASYFKNVDNGPGTLKYFALVTPSDTDRTMYLLIGGTCNAARDSFAAGGGPTTIAVAYWSENAKKSVCQTT